MEQPQLNEHNKTEYPPMHTCEHIVNRTMVNLFGCGRAVSTHIERMQQNFDIFDFSLSDEDMAAIATLDTGKSLFFDHHDAETVRRFMEWR